MEVNLSKKTLYMKGERRGPRKKALEEDQAVTHSPTSSSPNKIPSLEINPNSSIHNHLHYLSLVFFFFWMDIHHMILKIIILHVTLLVTCPFSM